MNAIGFRPEHPRLYRAYNIVVASVLALHALPVAAVITVALLLTQGPSIFYRGARMGKDGRTFHILKFRTLCSKRAAALTKDRTLPHDTTILTPLGGFLRDTRLDELPQLINVLKGDMNICGPRPVRAEIRDREAARIPDYDRRFEVHPGLLGPTQAYFGHGASKRIRARMNNISVRRPVNIKAEIRLTSQIIGAMVFRLFSKTARPVIVGVYGETARKDIWLLGSDNGPILPVDDMTFSELSIANRVAELDGVSLTVRLRSGALRRARLTLTPSNTVGTYRYGAADELSAYVIERYALGKVVVPPPVNRVRPPQIPKPQLEAVGV